MESAEVDRRDLQVGIEVDTALAVVFIIYRILVGVF